MDNPLGRQQPDFAAAADGLRVAASHLDRCPNLPAVNGGTVLIERMDAVLEQLSLLRRDFGDLSRKVDVS
jgi:hypothetical protein